MISRARLAKNHLKALRSRTEGRQLCAFAKANGEPCTAVVRWLVTRETGTRYFLCERHYNRLLEQRARRPEAFSGIEATRL